MKIKSNDSIRFLLLSFLFIFLSGSCKDSVKNGSKESLKRFYLRYYDWKSNVDTVNLNWDSTILTTVDTFEFLFRNKIIRLEKKISDWNKADSPPPLDGGFIAISEKNLGIFYSRPMCYSHNKNDYAKAYEILKTNNDSINTLITFLLGKMLTYPYFCLDTIPKDFYNKRK